MSKKIGSACARNRVKRVLREFFRQHQALLPFQVDLVVIPKKHLRIKQLALALVADELLPLLDAARDLHPGPEQSTKPGIRSLP